MLELIMLRHSNLLGWADSMQKRFGLIIWRSLYFVKDIKEGEVITKEHVKSIRPGYGLAPKYMEEIIGKKTTSAVRRGNPVSFELVK